MEIRQIGRYFSDLRYNVCQHLTQKKLNICKN